MPVARFPLIVLLPLACGALLGAQDGTPPPTRVDRLLAAMTLDEKIAMLHGAKDPGGVGQAGYLPGVPRLGIPPLRLTDGPAGVRTDQPATALPAPIALAASFSADLARQYGQTMGWDALARWQDVLLAPMVNIVRVPQGGRDFETLGEDPRLASDIVAAEVTGIQSTGVIATVKHFAENNQEDQRQSVSATVDERTMHEVELPGFEAAVKAGAGAVMAAYNKVNGTYASENRVLLTDVLRDQWKFAGFVMSDWGATHSAVPALTAGLDLEMPSGRYFGTLGEAVTRQEVTLGAIDTAVRRILGQMDRVGLLDGHVRPRPEIDGAAAERTAREIAEAGAVLLRNEGGVLPLSASDVRSLAVIGATAKVTMIGGGGSAHVVPFHRTNAFDALTERPAAHLIYAPGIDLDGVVVPASALATADGGAGLTRTGAAGGGAVTDATIDFTGASALPAGSTWTWTGTIAAPTAGDYQLLLQTSGGRGSLALDPPAAPPAPDAGQRGAGARGAGPGGFGRGRSPLTTSLLPTADGLSNASATVHFDAGATHRVVVRATAGATSPIAIRLAWVTPEARAAARAAAIDAARHARTAVVFAYDESSEGRDRTSLSLPNDQDALIADVAAANPRTVVVLSTGAPVLMPWVDRVAAVLQTWYPGQEGGDATVALLTGEVSPSGRLPETYPRRAEDGPANTPERYPGVDGVEAYSEGTLVGYRWYDARGIAPLFPFGFGLSYTTFRDTDLAITPEGDDDRVEWTVTNTGARAATDVPQVYIGPPAQPPVPMAPKQLVGFARVTLNPGESRRVSVHLSPRDLSYWDATRHAWVVAAGVRPVMIGASSRDIRLTGTLTAK